MYFSGSASPPRKIFAHHQSSLLILSLTLTSYSSNLHCRELQFATCLPDLHRLACGIPRRVSLRMLYNIKDSSKEQPKHPTNRVSTSSGDLPVAVLSQKQRDWVLYTFAISGWVWKICFQGNWQDHARSTSSGHSETNRRGLGIQLQRPISGDVSIAAMAQDQY